MRLSELQAQTKALGLEVKGIGHREAKAPYAEALRKHYLNQTYPNGLPYDELTPMLCSNYHDLHSKDQKRLWESGDWIVQRKLNGCRIVLHFLKGVGIFAHSRTVSESTFRRVEFTDRLLFRDFLPGFTATIDAEALINKPVDTRPYTKRGEVTKSSLHSTTAVLHMEADASRKLQVEQDATIVSHAVDVTNWQGADLKRKKLAERLGYLEEFRSTISKTEIAPHFDFPPTIVTDKKVFFEKVISEGGEGVVFKNLNSWYEDNNGRSRFGWVKLKKQIELDAYVSGFERGRAKSKWANYVSCLLFSVSTERGHRLIAKVSNLPWLLRKKISLYNPSTGELRLRPESYGACARICGLEFSQRAFRLVHPRIVHWRNDLTQDQCVYSADDLQAARMGSTALPIRKIENK